VICWNTALYTPAREVEGQEIGGGEQRGVEQIGEQNNRLLPGPVQSHAADEAPVLGLLTSLTTPSLAPRPAPAHPARAARGAPPQDRTGSWNDNAPKQ